MMGISKFDRGELEKEMEETEQIKKIKKVKIQQRDLIPNEEIKL